MGYGGALIWTGLARNLKKRWPEKKVVLVHGKSLKQVVLRKPYKNRSIYANNPDIDLVTDEISWLWQRWQYDPGQTIVVDMKRPEYLYWESQTPEHIRYKTGQHAIAVASAVHAIEQPELRPRVVLTREETRRADDVLAKHGLIPGSYLCLEPHTKTSFTPNKAWPFARWQKLASQLRAKGEKLVQVGGPGNTILDGVTDLTGKTSFRETGRVLEQAKLFIGPVGGLLHLARAMGTHNVVLVSPWEPRELATYPDDTNIFAGSAGHRCGKLTRCDECQASMAALSVNEVFDRMKAVL